MNAMQKTINQASENAFSDWLEAAIDTGNIADARSALWAAAQSVNIRGEFVTELRERFNEVFE